MKPNAPRRILVTGATGFLGGHLVQHLTTNGYDVVAHGRRDAGCHALGLSGYNVFQWDISAPVNSLEKLDAVDCVVHCAALSAPFGHLARFEAANIAGTRNVLDLAAHLNASRFVFISSPSVYFSLNDQLDVSEDMPLPNPFNAYAATKQKAEALVLDRPELCPVILRPRGIYGLNDTTLLPRILRAAKTRPLPLFRNGRASIDLTHVDDVVDAIECAINAPAHVEREIFNISSGEPLAVTDIVDQVCARAQIAVRWRKTPLAPALCIASVLEYAARLVPALGEPVATKYGLALFAYAQSLNISKARTLLGWSPKIRFQDGLEKTFTDGSFV
ncbi:MAG: NAD(P)-dependent oxidoreductase [Paracoccaceae bacterium]